MDDLENKIENKEDYNILCGDIDRSFEEEQITWKDHELLRSIAEKISWTL